MNIGKASKASGLSAKMIRYYESVGLLPEAARRDSNYRDYDEADIHRMVFIRRARELGFEVDLIRDLMGLWSDRSRSNAEVRAIAMKHVADMEAQAAKLQEMIGTLKNLVGTCKRGNRPDCPIMMELAAGADAPPVSPATKYSRRKQTSRVSV
jgi:MerR family gold-responsive transcriptional activator of gol and ges genes